MIVTLSLVCGTCGEVYDKDRGFILLRWCGACGKGICPTCFPVGLKGLDRCKACVEAGLLTKTEEGMRELGRKMGEARERRFWEAFLGD